LSEIEEINETTCFNHPMVKVKGEDMYKNMKFAGFNHPMVKVKVGLFTYVQSEI